MQLFLQQEFVKDDFVGEWEMILIRDSNTSVSSGQDRSCGVKGSYMIMR